MANIYIAEKVIKEKREARKQFIKDIIQGLFGVLFLSVAVIVFSVIVLGL